MTILHLSLFDNLALSVALLGAALAVRAWQRRARAAADAPDLTNDFAIVDRAAAGLLAGEEVSDAALSQCASAHDRIFECLCRRHGTTDNNQFSLADRKQFYIHCIKLAALPHPDHNAWPLRARMRAGLAPTLLAEAEAGQDPWLRLAAIAPALLAKDVDAAARLYRALPPPLAQLALQWVTETTIGHQEFNHVPSSQAWLRAIAAPAPAAPTGARDSLTPEQRWALSVSVYPSYAFDSRAALREPLPPAVARLTLHGQWQIDNAESAVRELEWLLEEGHRAQLSRELSSPHGLEPEKRRFLRESAAQLRTYGIVALDLCRLVSVARSAHSAGYIDEASAWRLILSAARKLRTTYPSWLALSDDYVLGTRYLADGEHEDAALLAYIEWLRHAPTSPWQTIPWSTSPTS